MLKSIVKSIIFVSLIGVVCGFEIPNYEGYITDKVGVFSESEKADLTSKIQEIEKTTSIEIAILVVSTVDDDINLAAVDVGNKRGVGKEGQDNGLILLIAVDDRKWSIQVGYGLEGTLPDLATKRIGEARFPPNFRESNYYQGVLEMLDDVLGYIKQDPTIVQNYSVDATSTVSFDEDLSGIALFLFFIIVVGFGRLVTIPKVKGTGRKMRKHGRWIYAGAGLIVSLLITWIIASFLIAAIMSYMFLLFGVVMAMAGKTGAGGKGIRFGGTGGSSWGGGGSSFGGFSGGSFGGGGSSGSR